MYTSFSLSLSLSLSLSWTRVCEAGICFSASLSKNNHAARLAHPYIILYYSIVHPVSITRFPLRRFSPGAGLLRYVCSLVAAKIFQGLGPKRREYYNGDRV